MSTIKFESRFRFQSYKNQIVIQTIASGPRFKVYYWLTDTITSVVVSVVAVVVVVVAVVVVVIVVVAFGC